MTRARPLVSVCIPVYNGEALVSYALDSCLAQTFKDFEVVVVDNASSDGTARVVKKYAGRDKRIRYFRNQENIGPARNFVKTLEYASGTFAQLLGHDDRLSPTYLEETVKLLDGRPEIAAVLPKNVNVALGPNGSLTIQGEVSRAPGTYSVDYFVRHMYRTPLGSLFIYGLMRRDDFLRATTTTLHAFENPPPSLLPEFSDFHKKGYGIDILIPLLVAEPYHAVVHTHRAAFMKLDHPASTGKTYGVDRTKASGVVKDYHYFRICHEYAYRTAWKRHLLGLRTFLGAEVLLSVLFQWLRNGFPRGYFDQNFFSSLRVFFADYRVVEWGGVVTRLLPIALLRGVRYAARNTFHSHPLSP